MNIDLLKYIKARIKCWIKIRSHSKRIIIVHTRHTMTWWRYGGSNPRSFTFHSYIVQTLRIKLDANVKTNVKQVHTNHMFHSCCFLPGGYNPLDVTYSDSHRPLDTVFRVSTKDESGWTEVTSLSVPRMYHHSVVLDGEIYTLGGQDHSR